MTFCGTVDSSALDMTTFDLGECWSDLTFTLVLLTHALTFGLAKILSLRSSKSSKKRTVRLYFFVGFFLLKIITSLIYNPISLNRSVALFSLCLIFRSIAYLFEGTMIFLENSKDEMRPSFTLFWFNVLDFLRASLLLKNQIIRQTNYSYNFYLSVFYAVFAFGSVLFLGFLSRKYKPELFPEHSGAERRYKEIEGSASVFSLLTFQWLSPLLMRGYKNQLNFEDLYLIKKSMQTDNLTSKFLKNLNKKKITRFTKTNLVVLLFNSFGYSFYFSMFLKFISDILLFVDPKLLNSLISFVNSNSPLKIGYAYVALLFANSILSAFVLNHYFYLCFRVAMDFKVFLMNFLYQKTLKLSVEEKQKQTSGEIVNLMSTDTETFLDLLPYLNVLWSAPLQLTLGIYFLYKEIGVASFVGLGIMLLLMIPGNTVVVRKMKNRERKIKKIKDERIKLTNEVLSSIKMIKLYAWEESFKKKINSIRAKELKNIKKYVYLQCLNTCTWNVSAVLVALGTFVFYTYMGNTLTASKAFTAIYLLVVIRFPLTMLPTVINSSVMVFVSLKRLVNFFNSREVLVNTCGVDTSVTRNNGLGGGSSSKKLAVFMQDASFCWDFEQKQKAISLSEDVRKIEIGHKELVMVIGPVGSGKSAFLSALLSDLVQVKGHSKIENNVAYVAQTPWIQNATIQGNILFGNRMNRKWYETVLEACCLNEDLKSIKGGELAEIGERGINLSGGQKQRIALARAVYAKKKIYLIDDTLSAVDPQVAQKIMKSCILGLLKSTTVIFNTNAHQFLKNADKIIVIIEGQVLAQGKLEEIKNMEIVRNLWRSDNPLLDDTNLIEVDADMPGISDFEKEEILRIVESRNEETEIAVSSEMSSSVITEHETNVESMELSQAKLVETEKREKGTVKKRLYWQYFKAHGGYLMMIIITLFFMLKPLGDYGTRRYLSFWTDEYTKNPNMSRGEVSKHIGVYSAISASTVLIVTSCIYMHAFGYIKASRRISENLLMSILRAPMVFFDTTPRGRILNRFSSDINALDRTIPSSVYSFTVCFFDVVAIVIVISSIIPWFLLSIVPLGVIYYYIQGFFLKPSRDIKRLLTTLKSPIYSSFQETIDGTSTIRAFKCEKRFHKKNEKMIDNWIRAFYPSFVANRWLSLRLEVLGSILILVSSSLVVWSRSKISPGVAGLSLVYSLSFVTSLNWMLRSASILENQVVSIERIIDYVETTPEAPLFVEDSPLKANQIGEGKIEFVDLKMKYRPELGYVLDGLTCIIEPKEKIGIVGRTGAGKSSLFNCLFRINEATSGHIYIDGVDISKLGLHELRSNLNIIPQDPVLFSGTIKFNLDPFDQYDDKSIWDALEACEIKDLVESLDYEVSEQGSNFSCGERQLICIARALLRKTKILLLDEATSSIDVKTDEKIQKTIRTSFKDFTVLTIAHRIDTIMDSDRVMVIERGKVAEFDSPKKLLENENSLFHIIVEHGID